MLSLALLLPLTFPVLEAQGARPNFIVIVLDDMSLAMLPYLPLTRSLVGEQGVTFTQAHASTPLCSPARATLLTGRYAHNHTVLHNESGAGGAFRQFRDSGSDRSTLATHLHAAGYRTGLFGKYINDYLGTYASYIPPGWDRWFAVTYNGTDYNWGASDQGVKRSFGSQPQDYSVDVETARAQAFIQAASSRPFLAYIGFGVPHFPVRPAARHESLFTSAIVPRTGAFNEADVRDKPSFFRLPSLTSAQIASLDQTWSRMVAALQSVDEAVRTIHETLRATGKLANTWILFTSDHGQHLGQHRLSAGKETAYDEDLRVPFLIRGPGGRRGTVDSTHMIVNADVTPTLLALAGVSVPASLDGRSAARLILSDAPPLSSPWRVAFPIERYRSPHNTLFTWPSYRGVRTANWTWVEWTNGERELYDLARDPQQLNNRAGDPSLADLRQRLSAYTSKLLDCVGASCRELERTGY
jgi:arylsulfatase A-like enzyme